MIKILIKAASASHDTSSYATPSVSVIEVKSEGMLCASGDFEEWNEETLPW
jgi:hypothetical protein